MQRAKLTGLLFTLILASGLLISTMAATTEDCSYCAAIFGGTPMARNENGALSTAGVIVLESRAFVVGYDDARMNPLWTCYRVYGTTQSGSGKSRAWKTDDRTGAQVSDNDYKHTAGDYDRGHMAPKSAMYHCYGQTAVDDTYVLSNACPQWHPFNDGPWGDLEDLIRNEYSVRFDEVWIIAGPIFDDSNGQEYLTKDTDHAAWAQKPVEIPDAFYKIIIDMDADCPRAVAFIIDHNEGYDYGLGETDNERLSGFIVSIDEIETATGLDFLWLLDDAIEASLESLKAISLW